MNDREPTIGVLTDAIDWRDVLGDLPQPLYVSAPSGPGGFPTRERLASLELIMVVGPLADVGAARQLGGVVNLAQDESRNVLVFAYEQHCSDADKHFLAALEHPQPVGQSPLPVRDFPDEFREYFTEYG